MPVALPLSAQIKMKKCCICYLVMDQCWYWPSEMVSPLPLHLCSSEAMRDVSSRLPGKLSFDFYSFGLS